MISGTDLTSAPSRGFHRLPECSRRTHCDAARIHDSLVVSTLRQLDSFANTRKNRLPRPEVELIIDFDLMTDNMETIAFRQTVGAA